MQADNIVIYNKGLLFTIDREPFETNAAPTKFADTS